MESNHLGYPAIHCKACGSYPPLVDDESVAKVIHEKIARHFSRSLTGCPQCQTLYFDHGKGLVKSNRYGHTKAGQQRLKCQQCSQVYTVKAIKHADKLLLLLEHIAKQTPTTQVITALDCAPKIYYQLLTRLSNLLREFSRQKEQAALQRDFLALHTESAVSQYAGNKALWCIATTEAQSGYCLLYSHNLLLQETLAEAYLGGQSSVLPTPKLPSILAALTERYQSTMRRQHFESLHYGQLANIRGAQYIKPSILAYAHFQLLGLMTASSPHFHHYIEHESAIRGAALMACSEEIFAEQAEVYFVYRHFTGGQELPVNGNNIGWWSDRWYGTHYGAYCPITYRNKYKVPFSLFDADGPKSVHQWLQQQQCLNLKSAKPLDPLIEIQRCLYNFCQPQKNQQTPAMRLGLSQQKMSLTDLLTAAIKRLEHTH
ncbi:hypothetical protein [Motilimonas eburnea]|uniref:hypothetical protein n=1 Tax=Motilimonas eburnea TaxID=1737488 RepID=UPI001E5DCE7E|nr:hypothetical protein [Motilimonas eburnea]MCE2570480.1 hypothetical protein [Motilimonas eburnea]